MIYVVTALTFLMVTIFVFVTIMDKKNYQEVLKTFGLKENDIK